MPRERPQVELRCECGCAILCLDWFPPFKDEKAEGYMDVYTRPADTRLGNRLRMAWRMVRGRDPWVDALVFGPRQAAQLQGFLALCNDPAQVVDGVFGGRRVTVRYDDAKGEK